MTTYIKPHMIEDFDAKIDQHVQTAITGLPALIATKLDASSYTAADVLTKVKTLDGVGSGLDADLLQGLALDRFLRYRTELADTEDLNNLITAGIWHQDSNSQASLARNYPVALAGSLTVKQYDSGYVYQEYHVYTNAYTYQRTKYSTTWYPWKRIIDSNRPMFSAHGTGGGAVGPYDLKLASTRVNVGSMYNPATGIATIQQAGVYEIHYSGLSLSGYQAHLQLHINGVNRTMTHSNVTTYSMDILSYYGPLAVGDQVKVLVPSATYGVYGGDGVTAGYARFWGRLDS